MTAKYTSDDLAFIGSWARNNSLETKISADPNMIHVLLPEGGVSFAQGGTEGLIFGGHISTVPTQLGVASAIEMALGDYRKWWKGEAK